MADLTIIQMEDLIMVKMEVSTMVVLTMVKMED